MPKVRAKEQEQPKRSRNPNPSEEILGIPRRITFMREERGLGLNECARKAGISSGVLSRLEDGSTVANVSAETILRVAKTLNVSVEWLMTGKHPRVAVVD